MNEKVLEPTEEQQLQQQQQTQPQEEEQTLEEVGRAALAGLREQYAGNEYMLRRLREHLVNHLPKTLANEWRTHQQRQTRMQDLTAEQKLFIQVFVRKHKYFYLPNNGTYFAYNNRDFLMVQADEIIHKLLSGITRDMLLVEWKHKTKLSVLRQIKERPLFSCVPESATIQQVLGSLVPAFFQNKQAAKHVLTVVGDAILRKTSSETQTQQSQTLLLYICSPAMRAFLGELEPVSQYTLGIANVLSNTCISKLHQSHAFGNCRLLRFREDYDNAEWIRVLKREGLNMLCVAVHYSKRYGSADQYLETLGAEDPLSNHVWYLKRHSPEEVVQQFCDECLHQTVETSIETQTQTQTQTVPDTPFLEWKQLHFVWKQFLSSRQLPASLMYANTLKQHLSKRFSYQEEGDKFLRLESKMSPVYHYFAQFWHATIRTVDAEEEGRTDLEVDELSVLFRFWLSSVECKTPLVVTEELLLTMLAHFFPAIEILDKKFLVNVVCSLWDKQQDIANTWPALCASILPESQVLSFDEAYDLYKLVRLRGERNTWIVSKRFFEQYLLEKWPHLVLFDKFLDASALMSLS